MHVRNLNTAVRKTRTARYRMTLTVRTVEALRPEEKSYTAWDDKLTGFGVRVQPSGLRSYLVNYRAGDRGRQAPNRRVVIGRHGPITPDQARRRAREILGRVALGDDPLAERARSRAMPTCAGLRGLSRRGTPAPGQHDRQLSPRR